MPGIFISYRREDTSGYAGRLYDRLEARFGRDTVFMDVDTIEPGVDAIEAIEERVGSCDVLIALIGKGWLRAADDEGRPRLHDPEDFVAVEIATALKRNVRLIPMLVDGARMPKTQELPETIARLTRRQGLELRHMSFRGDSDRLIEALEKALSPAAPEPPAAVIASRSGGSSSRPTVAIDFGITNAVLAFNDGAETIIIPNEFESYNTPCAAGVMEGGERVLGQVAKRQLIAIPDRTTDGIKLLMGRKRDGGAEDFPLRRGLKLDGNGSPSIGLAGQWYAPEEIAAMIFTGLKTTAESYLNEELRFAITVPAYFGPEQRGAIAKAAHLAGLDLAGLIEEPLAVVQAYDFGPRAKENVAVFHFGGGSIDLAIVELRGGNAVLKSAGAHALEGGDNIDAAIVAWAANAFKRQYKVDLLRDPMALQRLTEAAERAKIQLTSMLETEINLPFISATSEGPLHMQLKLRRHDLERSAQGILDAAVAVCERALKTAGVERTHITQVILSGGQTQMPAVQAAVREFFGTEPLQEIDPASVAAAGAAKQARLMGTRRAGA